MLHLVTFTLVSFLVITHGLPQNGYLQQQLPSTLPAKSFVQFSNTNLPPGACCQELAMLRSQGRILTTSSGNSIHSADKGYYDTQSSVGGNAVNGHLVVQQSGNKFSESNVYPQTRPKETILLISQRPPQMQTGFKPSPPSPPITQYVSANSKAQTIKIVQPSSDNSNGFATSQSTKEYSSNTGNQYTTKSQSLNSYGEALSSEGYASNSLNSAASDRYSTTAKLDSGYSYNGPNIINNIEGSASGFLSNIGEIAGNLNGGGTNVEKHIYVHVPPEDISEAAESHQQKQFQQLLQPKKHYKIVFIKAPTASSASSNYAQLLASQGGLSQEKTLIYVLSKKPDEPSIEELQKAAQQGSGSHITKPEVYFIKYKTRKDHNNGNYAGSDYGVDVRNAGSSSDINDSYANKDILTNQVGPSSPAPVYGLPSPSPAPVYGIPNIK